MSKTLRPKKKLSPQEAGFSKKREEIIPDLYVIELKIVNNILQERENKAFKTISLC